MSDRQLKIFPVFDERGRCLFFLKGVRALRMSILSIFAFVAVQMGGCGDLNENKIQQESSEILSAGGVLSNDPEAFGLTQAQCTTALVNTVTVSPRGQLYIDSEAVRNDIRARNTLSSTTDVAGVWSFAFAMREILELPIPRSTTRLTQAQIDAEHLSVESFIARFGSINVNGITSGARIETQAKLRLHWGKRSGKLWWGGAPFQLVAIVNRMDLVKFTASGAVDGTTAGEGRLVYGFTGPGAMTTILEYNLPVGSAASPSNMTQGQWTNLWHALKGHLVDTNAARAGVQPIQELSSLPSFSNQANYLSALQRVTDNFVLRRSQKQGTRTQAAIAQIRTNEFLSGPWELREIGRVRDAAGRAVLQSITVKNSLAPVQPSNVNVRSSPELGAWIDSNITCSDSRRISTCRFSAPSRMMSDTISQGASVFRVGGAAPADFRPWFQSNPNNIKRRFFALESCDGCHQSETGVFFTHTDPRNGAPSAFLLQNIRVGGFFDQQADLSRRLSNFRNLVCLAATSTALSLSAGGPVAPLDRRIDFSSSVH